MKNIKQFCKHHKKEIFIMGLVIATASIAVATKGRVKKNLIDMTGKSFISFKHNPPGNVMNLERVKEILDLNADNLSKYAIIRWGETPADYVTILLTDDVVL